MTTETIPPNTLESESASFGWRLQSARTTLSLEIKDIAAQLRLNEAVILMLEKDYLSLNLPTTFVRGYLRAYSKLLHIPDIELAQALELLKPKTVAPSTLQPSLPKRQRHLSLSLNLTNRHYTLFIAAAFISLVVTWWYTHTTPAQADIPIAQNQLSIPAEPSATVSLSAKQTTTTTNNITPAPAKAIVAETDNTDDDDEVDETD